MELPPGFYAYVAAMQCLYGVIMVATNAPVHRWGDVAIGAGVGLLSGIVLIRWLVGRRQA